MKRRLLFLIILPLLLSGQSLDYSTYYPLNIGDWREYSASVTYWDGIHYMKREGVIDTATIKDNLYYSNF